LGHSIRERFQPRRVRGLALNALFTGVVATAYAGAVVGAHRWNVWRLRSAAGGFRALHRLDWEALLEGVLPRAAGIVGEPEAALEPRRALVRALATGVVPTDLRPKAEAAGFSGGQAHWLELLALARGNPGAAFEQLLRSPLTTAAELYLREYLRLTDRTHPLNLELSVFAAKKQLSAGLTRFGDVPALHFARALASSLIGFNRAAIDDLARAVYYSGEAPFYVRAVLDTPFLDEARPALVFQCKQAATRGPA
jgi:hypothetical protein